MAKLTGPLLSFGASGQIAKTVVFGDWRGVKYGRQYVVPANPDTAEQQLTRKTFALLREVYKRMGTEARAPWDAFARARPATGMNFFVGENVRLLRGDADMQDFLGSPGANGGIAYPTLSAASGGTGAITATLTAPTLPTGWTINKAVAIAFPDQAPDGIFDDVVAEATDATSPYQPALSGLPASTLCVVSGWFVYNKPDGKLAYSVGQTTTATTGA